MLYRSKHLCLTAIKPGTNRRLQLSKESFVCFRRLQNYPIYLTVITETFVMNR